MTTQPPQPKTPEYGRFRYPRVFIGKEARRFLQYLIVRGLLAMASLMPIRFAQKLGGLLGSVLFPLSRRERGICLYNLGLAFPELNGKARKKLARKAFQHLGTTLFEVLLAPRFRTQASRWIRVEGEDVIKEAHAMGRGVVLVTGHMGNWELFSAVFETLKIPAQAMVRGIVNERIGELLMKHRLSPFLKPLIRGSSGAPRQLLSCLRSGEVLIVAIDQDIETQGVFVDFFGIPAHTPRVASALALRQKTPLVTGFGQRMPDGTHVFKFERIPVTKEIQEHPDAMHELTQLLTNKIEAQIRCVPEQWGWNHRRWKRRPLKTQK